MKEPNTLPPVFPQSCGCPQPAPLPCVPRVPSVLPGYDLYESMLNLTNRVNLLIDTYNSTIGGAYSTLDQLYKAVVTNGSYYAPDEVWEENKYDAVTDCQYTVIHKKAIDNCGVPIKMQTSFAYENNANTPNIVEAINKESYEKIADKIMVAQATSSTGYYGIIFKDGVYRQTTAQGSNMYTVGFTDCGEMKVYANITPETQLVNDKIVDSMGVPGIVIQYGAITDIAYQTQIPNRAVVAARVLLGYNETTHETIIFTCPYNTDETGQSGMTTEQAANLLLKEGATLAVEVISGLEASVLNMGMPYYLTADYDWPEGMCFWYISKKCSYKNNIQREVGKLFQKYAGCYTDLLFTQKKIENLKEDYIALEQRVTNAENDISELGQDLQALTTRVSTAETKITNLQNDLTALEGRVSTNESAIDALDSSVNSLESRMDTAEDDIDGNTTNITANETAINNIVNGTTKLSYLRATNTNGNTASSNISMNNNNVTNIGTAPTYHVIASPYQKYAVSYENLAKVLPITSIFSQDSTYPDTYQRYVIYGMLFFASGHLNAALRPSGSSVNLISLPESLLSSLDWSLSVYAKTVPTITPAGPMQYTPGTVLMDDGTVVPVKYWWRIGVSTGISVGFDTISGSALPSGQGLNYSTTLIFDPTIFTES